MKVFSQNGSDTMNLLFGFLFFDYGGVHYSWPRKILLSDKSHRCGDNQRRHLYPVKNIHMIIDQIYASCLSKGAYYIQSGNERAIIDRLNP
jgi:hypothetical protein